MTNRKTHNLPLPCPHCGHRSHHPADLPVGTDADQQVLLVTCPQCRQDFQLLLVCGGGLVWAVPFGDPLPPERLESRLRHLRTQLEIRLQQQPIPEVR
jgi:hypothetical protein